MLRGEEKEKEEKNTCVCFVHGFHPHVMDWKNVKIRNPCLLGDKENVRKGAYRAARVSLCV